MLEHNKILKLLFIFGVLSTSIFCSSACAECAAPQYGIGRVSADTSEVFDIDISIKLQDFDPSRLVCLASALKQQHTDRRTISVYIFSSHEAAENYVPLTGVDDSPKMVAWARKLHAMYFYNADKQEDYLLLIPDGLSLENDSPFNTRINLPITKAPRCRLELHDRCLLEFEHFNYAFGDNEPETSGVVVLSGTINKNGKLSKIHAMHTEVSPSVSQSLLLDKAIHNLSTWRFTSSRATNRLQITYSFEIVDSPALKYKTHVQFSLPDRVTIQTGQVN